MIIEVDQSGKLEETSQDTFIGAANGIKKTLRICAKEKRRLQKFFRGIGKPKLFAYRVFALLIFILIREDIPRISAVHIDTEYPGHDDLIKQYLLSEIRRYRPSFSPRDIVFRPVGKHSPAHFAARGVMLGKHTPTITATAKDVIQLLIQ